MNKYTLLFFIVPLSLAAGIYSAYKLLKFYNSPDAERYRKRSMQGPFVPLSAEDIAQDEARIAAAKSKPD